MEHWLLTAQAGRRLAGSQVSHATGLQGAGIAVCRVCRIAVGTAGRGLLWPKPRPMKAILRSGSGFFLTGLQGLTQGLTQSGCWLNPTWIPDPAPVLILLSHLAY